MNTKLLVGTLGLGCALIAGGSALAEVGIRDGADHFSDFKSSKSRGDVQSELIHAQGQGTSITMRDGDDSSLGAYGVAGSRYSTRTRDEVQAELKNAGADSRGSLRDPLYFGD